MGTDEGLCEPFMVPDTQSSYTSEEPSGSDNLYSSSMEGSTLVLCSFGDAVRLPLTTTLLTESVPVDIRPESDGHAITISCLAYL